MYIPDVYKIEDEEKIVSFIENNSFADLVTFHNESMCSNKVPFYFDKEERVLYGHFGRSNPQLVDIEESGDVLVIFSGPQSYVSPHWYESINGVPTWNYQTLQIRGRATLVDDNSLIKILENLSRFHEANFLSPWSMSEVEDDKLKHMLNMITGFKIDIDDINFKEKMSQNRSLSDQQSVINSLNEWGTKESISVARIMGDNINVNS